VRHIVRAPRRDRFADLVDRAPRMRNRLPEKCSVACPLLISASAVDLCVASRNRSASSSAWRAIAFWTSSDCPTWSAIACAFVGIASKSLFTGPPGRAAASVNAACSDCAALRA